MRVPPSYYGSTKAVPLFFKVKIYSGTDKLKTILRQFGRYISSKLSGSCLEVVCAGIYFGLKKFIVLPSYEGGTLIP